MAYIEYISYDDASDELRELYRRYGGANQTPANIVRIAGPNPKALEGHMALYRGIQVVSPLSRAQREMIAVVVSAINECHY